jgi:WD40 repeat protein
MALQCTADGRRVLAVAKLGELGIWEVPEDRFAASGVRLPPFDQAGVAQGAARVALATERAALVFDLAQGRKTEHPVDPAKRLRAVALSADGSRIALGYEQHGVEVVEVASHRSLGTLSAQGGRVTALAFSEDGQALVLGTAAGGVQIARLGRMDKPIEERAHRSAVTAVAVAGKGQAYATADESGLVAVWGKDGKRRASATLACRGVRVLCFAGDGPYALAAGCGDGIVHVVNPETGAVVAKHAMGGAPVTALAYARGKMALAAGTASGQVTLLAADA